MSPQRVEESAERLCPLETFRITRVVAAQWVAVSSVGFFAFAYLFVGVLAWIRGTALEPIVLPISWQPDVFGWFAVFVVLVVLVVALHETIHGLCMAFFGGEPAYGVGVSYFVVPYAYANSSGGYARNQMLAVLLAPFVVISVLGVAVMAVYPSPILVVVLAVNAAGSVGDLWMAAVLSRFPPSVRVGPVPDDSTETRGIGIYGSGDSIYGSSDDIFGSSGTTYRRTGVTRALTSVFAGTIATFVFLVCGLVATVFLSLAVGSGTVVIGDPGGRWFLFRHDVVPASGLVVLEVGERLLIGLALVGGFLWAAIDGARRTLVA